MSEEKNKHNAPANTIPKKQTELEPRHKRSGLRRILVFLGILLTLQLLFYFYSTPMLRNTVHRIVYTESDSLYTANFERIIVDLARGNFILQNFSVLSDSVRYEQLKKKGQVTTALYDIKFKEFKLSRLNLWQLIWNDELKIHQIQIVSPQIRLLNLPDTNATKKAKYDAVHNDLYPLLAKYANYIHIKKVIIPDGKFDLYIREEDRNRSSNIDKLSIELSHFKLDKYIYHNNKKLFYSDDIDLKINYFTQNMADGIHRLTASNIHISTKSGNMSADNIVLSPRHKKIATQHDTTQTFYVSVPSLLVQNANIAKAYFQKKVELSKVSLLEPNIQILKERNKQQNNTNRIIINDNSTLNLYQLIQGNLHSIKVDSFWIFRGNFELNYLPRQKKTDYDVDELSVTLYNFKLDSLAHLNRTKIFFSENIEIRMQNFGMNLPNGQHAIQAKELSISTINKHIFANAITIKPNYPNVHAQNTNLLNLRIPTLEITGLDLKQAYNQQNIPIQSLKLVNPKINLKIYRTKLEKRKRKTKDSIAFLNEIIIKNLHLTNADIEIQQFENDSLMGYIKAEGKLHLSQFKLNKNTLSNKQVLFLASGLNINLNRLSYKSPHMINQLAINHVMLSTQKKHLLIEGFLFFPSTDSVTYQKLKKYNKKATLDIAFEKLELTDFDISKAYFTRKIQASNIELDNAKLTLTGYKKKKTNLKKTNIVLNNQTQNLPYFHSRLVEIIDSLQHQANLFSPNNTDTDTTLLEKKYHASFKQMSKQIKQLDAERILIKNSYVIIQQNDTNDNALSKTQFGVNFWADKVHAETDSVINPNQYMVADNWQWGIRNFSHVVYKNQYHLKAKNIEYNSLDNQLNINYLRLVNEQNNKEKTNRVFTEFFVPKISFVKPQWYKILKHNIQFDELNIDDPSIFSLNHQADSTKRIKTHFLPQQLHIPFSINNIDINKLTINRGKFATRKHSFSDNEWYNSLFFDIKTTNIKTSSADSSLNFTFDEPEIELSEIKANFGDKMHQAYIPKATYKPENKGFLIDSLAVWANDSTRWTKLQANRKKTSFGFYGKNTELKMLNWQKLLFERYVSAKQLYIDSLQINYYKLITNNFETDGIDSLNFFRPISKSIAGINIDNILAPNIHLNVSKSNTGKKTSLHEINAFVSNFSIDSATQADSSRFFYAKNIVANMPNISFLSEDGIYLTRIQNIQYQHNPSVLSLKNVYYQPVISDIDIAPHFKKQKSAIHLATPLIQVHNFNIVGYARDKSILSSFVEIKNPYLYIYKDKRLFQDDTSPQPMIQQMLHKYPHPLKIDSLKATGMLINVKQHKKGYTKPAFVSINDMKVNAYNVANIEKNNPKYLKANATGYLMDNGLMRIMLKAPVGNNNSNHTIAGSLDTMNLQALNPLLENIANAHIKKGKVQSARFKMDINDSIAEGNMILRYSGLRVRLIKQDLEDSTQNARGFISFFANRILPKRNPKAGRRVKPGEIYFKRTPDESVPGFWVQGILSGIRSTTGFESKEQKQYTKQKFKLLKINEKKERIEARMKRRQNRQAIKNDRKQQKYEQKIFKQLQKERTKDKQRKQQNREKQQKEMLRQEIERIK